MDKIYFCYGGHIISQNDGDRHFVTARQVAELYGLNIRQQNVKLITQRAQEADANLENVVKLYPKSNGDYTLPD